MVCPPSSSPGDCAFSSFQSWSPSPCEELVGGDGLLTADILRVKRFLGGQTLPRRKSEHAQQKSPNLRPFC